MSAANRGEGSRSPISRLPCDELVRVDELLMGTSLMQWDKDAQDLSVVLGKNSS